MIGSTILNGAPLNEAGDDSRYMSGMDLVTVGAASLVITVDAVGAMPLEIGPLEAQNGVPFAFAPAGLDVVSTSTHSAQLGASPVTLDAISAFPLEVGDLAVFPSPIDVYAEGANPLEIGDLGAGLVLSAQSAEPMEVGPFSYGWSLRAQGAMPFDLGDLGLRVQVSVGGAAIGSSGQHSIAAAGVELAANGATTMEIGPLGAIGMTLHARPSYPLQIGALAVSRAATC